MLKNFSFILNILLLQNIASSNIGSTTAILRGCCQKLEKFSIDSNLSSQPIKQTRTSSIPLHRDFASNFIPNLNMRPYYHDCAYPSNKTDLISYSVVNTLQLDHEEENALQEDARILALLNLTLRCCQEAVTGSAGPESDSAYQVDYDEEEELVQLALRIESVALRCGHSSVGGAGDPDMRRTKGRSKAELLYQRGRALFSDKGQWRAAEVCRSRTVLRLGLDRASWKTVSWQSFGARGCILCRM
jgi:hypothetical protein